MEVKLRNLGELLRSHPKAVHAAWKAIAPIAVGALIAFAPPPAGLALHAWRFFGLFAAVILALVLQPLPGGAVGVIGVTLAILFAPWMLFSPAQLAAPGFRVANAALSWALSGFADGTVWLILGAYMFALGYEKTGLGRRIALLLVRRMGASSLALGYAVMLADLALAPFTPSNTARSGGTIYPVIRNLPGLYASLPNDPSSRRIGSYLMWVAVASVNVTSSLFLTGMAPNLLAVQLVRQTVGIEISWTLWFLTCAPAGVVLLALLPLLTYWIYPPSIKISREVPEWAAGELQRLGPVTRSEIKLACVVLLALALWIFAGGFLNAASVALLGLSLLLVLRVFSWSDVTGNAQAWSAFIWFATLITMADGLNRVGFVGWTARTVTSRLTGISPSAAMFILLGVFFLAHYFFASIAAHTTALLPVMLAAGASIPGLRVPQFTMLLCLELGIMGVITPYAAGPSPIYQGSGYLPSADYWRLGAIFGFCFLSILWLLCAPWSAFILSRS
jgi:L-tartrate/succinate antiporter